MIISVMQEEIRSEINYFRLQFSVDAMKSVYYRSTKLLFREPLSLVVVVGENIDSVPLKSYRLLEILSGVAVSITWKRLAFSPWIALVWRSC